MITTAWLKVGSRKRGTSFAPGPVSIYKTKPSCRGGEVLVRLEINIPDAYFSDPLFEAKVNLPSPPPRALPQPAEIGKSVADALGKQLGFTVRVEMTPEQIQQSGGT
jgi:hypothetical protein